MDPLKRQAVLFGLLAAALAACAAWNVHWMLGERRAARRAAEDLAACRDLARAIESLRAKPRVASTEGLDVQELGERIEAASRRAGLEASALVGRFPQAPRRIGDSPYLAKPTTLALRGVTLARLATFLFHLADGSGLTVRDLRLREAAGGDAPRDVWDAEATVTSLVYAPAGKGGT
jgi:hypothetical protein